LFRVCLSHDIDRVVKSHQYLTRSLRSLSRGDWRGVYRQIKSLSDKHPYWGFDHLLEIEDSLKVRSTVFFLNESIRFKPWNLSTYQLALGRYRIKSEKITDIIKYLDRNGWEIGVHGSYNSYQSQELLQKEKLALENVVQHEILGIRQHYAQLADSTWKYQSRAGFKYDSSLGYTNAIGFKDERFVPFFPLNSDFLEIPLVVMDMCFVGLKDKWASLESIIELCKERDAVLVVNYHQHVFYSTDFPGYREDYVQIINKCKEHGACFSTLSEVYWDELRKREPTKVGL